MCSRGCAWAVYCRSWRRGWNGRPKHSTPYPDVLLILDDFGMEPMGREPRHLPAAGREGWAIDQDIAEWIATLDEEMLAQSAVGRFKNNAYDLTSTRSRIDRGSSRFTERSNQEQPPVALPVAAAGRLYRGAALCSVAPGPLLGAPSGGSFRRLPQEAPPGGSPRSCNPEAQIARFFARNAPHSYVRAGSGISAKSELRALGRLVA